MKNRTVKDIYDAFGQLIGIEGIEQMTKAELKMRYPELYEKIWGDLPTHL